MVAKNPITGDLIQTKSYSKEYDKNYDIIFTNSDGYVKDLYGNNIKKCCKRCWMEFDQNNRIVCNKPNCERG